MPGPRPTPKKTSKPVPLGGVKKTPKSAAKKANTAKSPSPRKVAGAYRKKAQATRLTPRQRQIIKDRDKDAAMDRMYEITKNRFGMGM